MKLFTTTLLAFLTIMATAQTKLPSETSNTNEPVNFEELHARYPWVFPNPNDATSNKRSQNTGWYNYVNTAFIAGVEWTNITNTSLFPDSTVLQVYRSADGGSELGFTGLHNIGEIFDPKYEFFPEGELMSRFNNYTVDSVAFFYRYSHNKPGTVDTLRIQFYQNAQVRQVNFANNVDSSVSVQYNAAQNRSTGTNFISEIEILLDEDDTTGDELANAMLMSVAVPNGGLKPTPLGKTGRNNVGLVAFTMTYHPGYAYSFGDTLQHDWDNPPVVNKLNHFRPSRVSDQNNNNDDQYNRGLFIFRTNLYDNPNSGWPNLFVPGDAFNDSKDHLFALFHCISDQTINTTTLNEGYSLSSAYPNPAAQGSKVNVDFELANTEQVSIELYNVTGTKVADVISNQTYTNGKHTVSINLQGLSTGMYFYTIKAGNYTASKKLTIY